ncbi:hypothetical protein LNAOJCKE_4786 [Methylorubrum aminovorans]|uniref:Uncharacterized protein n=1 Tax=Methylorubrum aminovorans TaxID=269069 RepID=A0ABQ4UJX4_9HYPH|nr:hypothetical protein [Methylorubrum aminovorans]GJE67554.1 hypothetical protein LNAOJCKE_4786 [Methylorubrum aminovorans]GMA74417.1 hypothetical protein GCM10025880_08340 [Methylorubrum aminovorans]
MSATSTERPIRGVNVVVLSDGREVHLDDITTAAEGQTILDDLDGAILGIEDQLAFDDGRNGPVWRKRAEMALKKKRRQRPGLQQRIGDLRRAEKRAAQPEPATSHKDAKRKAFIDAAEELLSPEVFTEVWTRAAERVPAAFADTNGRVS